MSAEKSTNRKKLSKLTLEMRYDPERACHGRMEIRDTESPLVFRLTENGARSLCIRTRIGRGAGKPVVRLTYPGTAVIENLHDARVWANMTVTACMKGQDPRQTAERAAREAEKNERLKIETVVENYIDRRVRREKGNRTADTIERTFEIYVLPRWRGRLISEITREDVNQLLDEVFDRKVFLDGRAYGGERRANAVLAELRTLFKWYSLRDDKFVSPIVSGMARQTDKGKPRDRILTDEEIRNLWKATAGAGTYNSLVRLLLLTAQRRDEVAGMGRSEIDEGVWTLPAERAKNKRPNPVPLSPAALEIVKAQPLHMVTVGHQMKNSDLIFTTNGRTPFSGFTKAKATLDKAMGVSNWRLHDLRRTAKSLMARAKIRPDISERVLGHVIPGVEGVYDRYDYVEEKRAALEALAALVERIVNPPEANVIPMHVVAAQ